VATNHNNTSGCLSFFITVGVIVAITIGLVGLLLAVVGLGISSLATAGVGFTLLVISVFALDRLLNRGSDASADHADDSVPSDNSHERPSPAQPAPDQAPRPPSSQACPECDAEFPTTITTQHDWSFCPACGHDWPSSASEPEAASRQLHLFDDSPTATPETDHPPPEAQPPETTDTADATTPADHSTDGHHFSPTDTAESTTDSPSESPSNLPSEPPEAVDETTSRAERATTSDEPEPTPDPKTTPDSDSTPATDAQPEPTTDQPSATADDTPAAEPESSTWQSRLLPLVADNWLYVLGSILVLGSGAYAIAYVWHSLSTVFRHLLTTGLLTTGVATFAGLGRWLDTRFEAGKGGDIFWLIGSGLALAAAISAGLARPFSPLLGWGLIAAVTLACPLLLTTLHPLADDGHERRAAIKSVTWGSAILFPTLAVSTHPPDAQFFRFLLPTLAGATAAAVAWGLAAPTPPTSEDSTNLAGDHVAALTWLTTAVWPLIAAALTAVVGSLRAPTASSGETVARMAPGFALLALAAIELLYDDDRLPARHNRWALVASAAAAASVGAALFDHTALLLASLPAALTHYRARRAHPVTLYGLVGMLAAGWYAAAMLLAPHLGFELQTAGPGARLLIAFAPLSLLLGGVATRIADSSPDKSRALTNGLALIPVISLLALLLELGSHPVTPQTVGALGIHAAVVGWLGVTRNEPILGYLAATLFTVTASLLPQAVDFPDAALPTLFALLAVIATLTTWSLERHEYAHRLQRAFDHVTLALTALAITTLAFTQQPLQALRGTTTTEVAWWSVAAFATLTIAGGCIAWLARRTARQTVAWVSLITVGAAAGATVVATRETLGIASSGTGKLFASGLGGLLLAELALRLDSLARPAEDRSPLFGLSPPDDDTPDVFHTPFNYLARAAIIAAIGFATTWVPPWATIATCALAGTAALRLCAGQPDSRLPGILAPIALVAWTPRIFDTFASGPLPDLGFGFNFLITCGAAALILELVKWVLVKQHEPLTRLHASGLRRLEPERGHSAQTDAEDTDLDETPVSLRTLWQTSLIIGLLFLLAVAIVGVPVAADDSPIFTAEHAAGFTAVLALITSDLLLRPSRASTSILVFTISVFSARAVEHLFAPPDDIAPILFGAATATYLLINWSLSRTDATPRLDLVRRWTGFVALIAIYLFAAGCIYGFGVIFLDNTASASASPDFLAVGALIITAAAFGAYRMFRHPVAGFALALALLCTAPAAGLATGLLLALEWHPIAVYVAVISIIIGLAIPRLFTKDAPDDEPSDDAANSEPAIPGVDYLIPRPADSIDRLPANHRPAWDHLRGALNISLSIWALYTVSLLAQPLLWYTTVSIPPAATAAAGIAAILVTSPGLLHRRLGFADAAAAITGSIAVGTAAGSWLPTAPLVVSATSLTALLLALQRTVWHRRAPTEMSAPSLREPTWMAIFASIIALVFHAASPAPLPPFALIAPVPAIVVALADRVERTPIRLATLWSLCAFPFAGEVLLESPQTGWVVGATLTPVLWTLGSLFATSSTDTTDATVESGDPEPADTAAIIAAEETATGAVTTCLAVGLAALTWTLLTISNITQPPPLLAGALAAAALVTVATTQFLRYGVRSSGLALFLTLSLGPIAAALAAPTSLAPLIAAFGYSLLCLGTAAFIRTEFFPAPDEPLRWLPAIDSFLTSSPPPASSDRLSHAALAWGAVASLPLIVTNPVGLFGIVAAGLLVAASHVGARPSPHWTRALLKTASLTLLFAVAGQSFWQRPIFVSTGLIAASAAIASLPLAFRSRHPTLFGGWSMLTVLTLLSAFAASQPTAVTHAITFTGFIALGASWSVRLALHDSELEGYLAALAFTGGYLYLRLTMELVPASADPWVAQAAGVLILVLEGIARRTDATSTSSSIRRVTLILTILLPAAGWLATWLHTGDFQPGVFAGGGSLYLLAGWQLQARGLFLPALLIFNAEILLGWVRGGVTDPVLYALPVGLTLIACARIYGDQLGQTGRNWLRGAGCLIIYATSSYHLFAFDTLQPVLITGGLALTGVLAGLFLRVRSYLYFGTITLLLDLAINLFRVGTDDALIGTAILFTVGVLMLAAGVAYNVRREAIRTQLTRLRHELQDWE